MKKLMTGNEALVRGAWEAGVNFASAYPGTPSTEILENMSGYKEVYSEWAPNEKWLWKQQLAHLSQVREVWLL